MLEIIRHLTRIEDLASQTYELAKEHFTADEEFYQFIGGLAEEEIQHREALKKIVLYMLENNIQIGLDILPDPAYLDGIERTLQNFYDYVSCEKIEKHVSGRFSVLLRIAIAPIDSTSAARTGNWTHENALLMQARWQGAKERGRHPCTQISRSRRRPS